MTLAEIRMWPTIADAKGNYHESCFRSFHILNNVKELLAEGCPAPVLLAIVEDLQNAPNVPSQVELQPA